MKKNLMAVFFVVASFTFTLQAQVGINTESPQKSLDVNGDIQIRGKIFLGGNDTQAGDPGETEYVLVSGGSTDSPRWKELNIPTVEAGGFYLKSSYVFRDRTGIDCPRSNQDEGGYGQPYAENAPLSEGDSGWKRFPSLGGAASGALKIMIPEKDELPTDPAGTVYNRTSIQIQTVVQAGTGIDSDKWITYAVAVFIKAPTDTNFLLKGVRVGRLTGGAAMFQTFDVSCMIDNLEPGEHEVVVVGKRRDSGSGDNVGDNFSIGKVAANQTNINDFMTQTTCKIEVFKRDASDD